MASVLPRQPWAACLNAATILTPAEMGRIVHGPDFCQVATAAAIHRLANFGTLFAVGRLNWPRRSFTGSSAPAFHK